MSTDKPDTIDLVAWAEWFKTWRDAIRAPVVIIAAALAAVAIASTCSALDLTGYDVPAWTNGIAAIIAAVAALAESRHSRAAWVDHEVRS